MKSVNYGFIIIFFWHNLDLIVCLTKMDPNPWLQLV